MKGKIVITDKVYFEPDGLEKPDKFEPRFWLPGWYYRIKCFNKALKEYEASK